MADGEQDATGGVSRRTFLVGSGVALGGAGLVGGLLLDGLASGLSTSIGPPTFTRWVRRREDFLNLRFDFYNLVRDTRAGAKPQLIRKASSLPAYVVVTFPPQHLAEEAFWEDAAAADPTATRPVRAVLAGASRVGFLVPPTTATIPLTYDALLAWADWPLVVAPAADPGVFAVVRAPLPHETAIEMPWRLQLSPSGQGRFTSAARPVTRNGRTEVWHARLGTARPGGGIDERNVAARSARAVWCLDNELPAGGDPFADPGDTPSEVAALTQRDRLNIHRQSTARGDAAAVHVDRLYLSSLGGWLDARGEWATGSLAEWRHRATMGRDHYVKVAYRGFLYPFGHPAMVVHVAERKFTQGRYPRTAFLRKRKYVVVAQPVLDVGAASHDDRQRRQFPFRTVELVTRVTPNLDGVGPGESDAVFVPRVLGTPLAFAARFTDVDGNVTATSMPLVFIGLPDRTSAGQPNPPGATDPITLNAAAVAALYDGATGGSVSMGGQRVAYAPPAPATPGATTLETAAIRFVADAAASFQVGLDSVQAPFTPLVGRAKVALRAASTLATGAEDLVSIELDDRYLANEFGAGNVGGTFAKLVDDAGAAVTLPVGLPPELAGGLASPGLALEGLSRDLGPVGDLANLAQGKVDVEKLIPKEAIAGLLPKLLGTVDLSDVLPRLPDDPTAMPAAKSPVIDTTLEWGNGRTRPPTGAITRFDWSPGVQDVGDFFVTSVPAPSVFELHSVLHTDLVDPERSDAHVWGRLTNVEIRLFGSSPFITVPVRRMAFDSRSGGKTDVDVDLGTVRFGPPLDFIEELSKLLRFGGSGGPYVDVSPTGVVAGVSVALPNVQIGVFQVSNVVFAAQANLPFDGEMSVDFSVARREKPAVLTVSCFGGGFWCELGIGLDGLRRLDVGLEFGAAVALNVGVASGEVHVFAGIYMTIDNGVTPNVAKFGGYLRVGGSVCVLGIVTVSVELQLGFDYDVPSQKATAYGTMHLEVEVFMFSKSFDVRVERRFGASPGDPRFLDQVETRQDWDDYCGAFASIGA